MKAVPSPVGPWLGTMIASSSASNRSRLASHWRRLEWGLTNADKAVSLAGIPSTTCATSRIRLMAVRSSNEATSSSSANRPLEGDSMKSGRLFALLVACSAVVASKGVALAQDKVKVRIGTHISISAHLFMQKKPEVLKHMGKSYE